MDGNTMSRALATMLLLCCMPPVSLSIAINGDSTQNNKTSSSTAGKTYVFVHGAFGGAWCWYKIATMMQEVNFNVVLLDLASGGVDRTRPDSIKTIADYSKPLTDYLSSIDIKVMLVGHGTGGAAVSYAMEQFPDKIEKAVFVQAVMPKDGETPGLYINGHLANLVAQDVLIYNFNSGGAAASSISINTTVAGDYFFNRTPPEDKNLALTLLSDSPYSILNEVMNLSEDRYGSIKRFYIMTTLDKIFPSNVQQQIYTKNPPKQKFVLKNGDHASFFSETPYLFNTLRSLANSEW